MCSAKRLWKPASGLAVVAFLCTGTVAEASQGQLLTAAGKPAEGPLDVFLGEPRFDMQVVFDEGDPVREPYLAIALDGTLLALRNNKGELRRSEDGGRSWGEIINVPITHSDSNMIVDENTGNIMSVRMWNGTDRVFRSTDHGKTWTEQETTIQPNKLMKRLGETGLKKRATKGDAAASGTHSGAARAFLWAAADLSCHAGNSKGTVA